MPDLPAYAIADITREVHSLSVTCVEEFVDEKTGECDGYEVNPPRPEQVRALVAYVARILQCLQASRH